MIRQPDTIERLLKLVLPDWCFSVLIHSINLSTILPILVLVIFFGPIRVAATEPSPDVVRGPAVSSQDDAKKIQSSLQQHVQAMFRDMSPEARRGYQFLTEKVYLPADFNEQVLRELDEQELSIPFPDAESVSRRLATWRAFGIALDMTIRRSHCNTSRRKMGSLS